MRVKTKRKTIGFTLVELMIVIVIIVILVVIAIPNYQAFTQRAHFTGFVYMVTGRQTEVITCFNSRNTFVGCNGGATNSLGGSISPDLTTPVGDAVSIVVTDGVITGQASTLAGGYTYILTPTTTSSNFIIWNVSGTCVAAGMCHSS